MKARTLIRLVASTRNSRSPAWHWFLIFGALIIGTLPLFGAAAPTAAPASARIFHWRPFLAPFHAVVLHFPIGFVTVAFLLEAYRAFRPSDEIRRVTVMVLWLGLITGVISASFGLMRAGSGEYEARLLELHRIFGLGVPVATVFAVAIQRVAHRNEARRGWTTCYRGVLTGTIALVVIAGHYGGNLTHGSKYLVENAPEFVRDFLDEDLMVEANVSADANGEKARLYLEKVQPILAAKCYSCHGQEKQKGGLRLDEPELALKGGESGDPGIKPGDPIKSQVVRLILLPPNHDDVMPPEGKQPLTSEEIMTLIEWIRSGAAFPETGAALTATNHPG